jgi:hypothetical protein
MPRPLTSVVALLLCSSATLFAEPPGPDKKPFQGKKLLFVAGAPSDPRAAGDLAIKAHFESLGFTVTPAGEADPASRAEGQDIVVISSTVGARRLMGRYKQTPIPVVTWEAALLDEMGMTGKRPGVDFGESDKERFLWLVNAPHSLQAGLPAGKVEVHKKLGLMGWGKPGLGAIIIATLPGQPDKVAMFAYKRGATMDYDFLAPGHRVFLFIESDALDNLTDAGLALFDAAFRWSLLKPKAE